jgi:predicted transcriptional regulator
LLVLSIHPRFAGMILRGEKTVELRRRAPRCPTDFWIAIYSTSPERAMIGVVRASGVLVASPDELWGTVEGGCGLGREEYRSYYQGADRAVGITLSDPTPFTKPVSLDQLRSSWPEFRPPQSFAYLAPERVHDVWGHAGMCFVGGAKG